MRSLLFDKHLPLAIIYLFSLTILIKMDLLQNKQNNHNNSNNNKTMLLFKPTCHLATSTNMLRKRRREYCTTNLPKISTTQLLWMVRYYNLNPWQPLRGRQLMAPLISSHDWYVTYRPETASKESHMTEKRK